MAAIRLQFVTEAGFGAWLVRWFSHGRYSHVDAVLPDGRLLGARTDHPVNGMAGVEIRPPGYARFTARCDVNIETTPAESEMFYNWLRQQIGKPYDWTAIFGFAVARNWRDPRRWFCSELIAAGLEKAGMFACPLAATANKITPCDLALLLSAITNVRSRHDLW